MKDLPTVRHDGTIREAMAVIDAGAAEISLVVDESNRVRGTVTDGDVRRGLLRGLDLDAPVAEVVNRNFVSVAPGTPRAEVLDLMRARTLAQIPIVEEDGRLAGLHLLREVIGIERRPNWAVIMAGGRGERLRPITDVVPKPMVRVAGRPILERIVLHLTGFGVRRIFLAINYLGEQIERHFGDGAKYGCRIDYLKEERPLGTGGALSLLPGVPDQSVLVMNGDLVTQFDVGRLLAHHQQGGFRVTVAVHEYAHRVPYGVVETKGDRITGLSEKPTATWVTNAGIYAIDPVLLHRVPEDKPFPLPSLVEQCLEDGTPVGFFHIEDDWHDVGRPRELDVANGGGNTP